MSSDKTYYLWGRCGTVGVHAAGDQECLQVRGFESCPWSEVRKVIHSGKWSVIAKTEAFERRHYPSPSKKGSS